MLPTAASQFENHLEGGEDLGLFLPFGSRSGAGPEFALLVSLQVTLQLAPFVFTSQSELKMWNPGSSHCGSVETNPDRIHEDEVS